MSKRTICLILFTTTSIVLHGCSKEIKCNKIKKSNTKHVSNKSAADKEAGRRVDKMSQSNKDAEKCYEDAEKCYEDAEKTAGERIDAMFETPDSEETVFNRINAMFEGDDDDERREEEAGRRVDALFD